MMHLTFSLFDREALTINVQNTNTADSVCVESVDIFVKQGSRWNFCEIFHFIADRPLKEILKILFLGK